MVLRWLRSFPRYSSTSKLSPFIVILAGASIHLTLGTLYTLGNMSPYIVSYIRQYGHPKWLNAEVASWIYALAIVGQGTAMFFGGLLELKFGTRITSLIGGWIMSAGVALTYFTIHSFWLLLITYGLMFGLGIGLAYAPPLACAIRWLPKHKGFAAGCVVAGFGLGAFIFDQVQTAFINPKGVKPISVEGSTEKYFDDEDVLLRTKKSFLLLGACYAVIQLLSAFFLVDPSLPGSDNSETIQVELKSLKRSESPELPDSSPDIEVNTSMLEVTDSDETSETELINTSSDIHVDFKPREILRSKNFYAIWVMFFLSGQGVVMISTLYKSFGFEFIKSDRFLALVGALASVCNALGRILWSYLADRFSFRLTVMAMLSVMAALLLSFGATSLAGEPMFLIWISLLFSCIGGVFSLYPVAIVRAFGPKYFAANYGIAFTSQILAGPVGAFLPTILSQTLGFIGLWYLSAGILYVAVLIAFSYTMPLPRANGFARIDNSA
eukprot:m.20520 g.20520  ORF g.20520 m.20520 type:complete len:496 (+) comp28022_c0_seq1:33-1520(+)